MAWCYYRRLAPVQAQLTDDGANYRVRSLGSDADPQLVPRELFEREHALLPQLALGDMGDARLRLLEDD